MITLSTADEAFAHLSKLLTFPNEADTDIHFKGELEAIQFVFEGPGFKHSVPGDLAKGLATYQDAIYRAAKFALYGSDGRFQLSAEERKSFELIFQVNDGCTELLAPIEKIIEALAKGVEGMDSTTLAIVIVLVVLILVGGHVAYKIHEGIQNTKQKKIEEDGRNALAETIAKAGGASLVAQSDIIKVLVSEPKYSVARQFEAAQDVGVKEVLKSVPQATEVEVNGVPFDSDDIREIKRKAKRAKSEYSEVMLSCNVYADTNYSPTRLTLTSPELPSDVKVDWPDDVDGGKDAMLWHAVKRRERIILMVGVTVINGKAKSGVILDVVSPDEVSVNV